MKTEVFTDYLGRDVRLTAERRKHILDHPEMQEWVEKIPDVLARPDRVVRSRFDPESELFYVWKTRTRVGAKCLIRSFTVIENCTLGDNVLVRQSCVLSESSVSDGAKIGPKIGRRGSRTSLAEKERRP